MFKIKFLIYIRVREELSALERKEMMLKNKFFLCKINAFNISSEPYEQTYALCLLALICACVDVFVYLC